MKKTYLLLIGIVAFLLTLTVGAAELPFTDVPADAWYYADVQSAYESGLINGVTETEFAPDENLTYAAAVKLAACIHQLYTEGEVTLTAGTPWYQPYVDYAAEKGVAQVKKNEFFYSNTNLIDRDTFIDLFSRALPEEALAPINRIDDGAIRDVPKSASYSEAVYTMYRAGITQGSGEQHWFQPNAYITRAEVSTILTRMMNPETRVSFTMERTMSEECREAYADFLKNAENIGGVFDLIYLDNDDEPELVVTDNNSAQYNGVDIYGYTSEGVERLAGVGQCGELTYLPQDNVTYQHYYSGNGGEGETVDVLLGYGQGVWGYAETNVIVCSLSTVTRYADFADRDTMIQYQTYTTWDSHNENLAPEQYKELYAEYFASIPTESTKIYYSNMYDLNEETIEAVFQ